MSRAAARLPAAAERSVRQGGAALDARLRARLKASLGSEAEVPLRDARIHTDADADEAARALGADAVTTGRHILFRAGAFAPDAAAGWALLVHEAAHVVQGGSHEPEAGAAPVALAAPAEVDADRALAQGEVRQANLAAPALRSATARVDPARLAGDVAAALIARFHGDSGDTAGRIRQQLIAMAEPFRRDVLRAVERHLGASEWGTFLETISAPLPPGIEGTTADTAPPEARVAEEQAAAADAETRGDERAPQSDSDGADVAQRRSIEGREPTEAAEGARSSAHHAEAQASGLGTEVDALDEDAEPGASVAEHHARQEDGKTSPETVGAKPQEVPSSAPPEPERLSGGVAGASAEPAPVAAGRASAEGEEAPPVGQEPSSADAGNEGEAMEAAQAGTVTSPGDALVEQEAGRDAGENTLSETADAGDDAAFSARLPALDPVNDPLPDASSGSADEGPAPVEAPAPEPEPPAAALEAVAGNEPVDAEAPPAQADDPALERRTSDITEEAGPVATPAVSVASDGDDAATTAIPPDVLGEFSSEPADDDAGGGAPTAAGGGGSPGGASPAPEEAEAEATGEAGGMTPEGALTAAAGAPVARAGAAVASAQAASQAEFAGEADALTAAPPTLEQAAVAAPERPTAPAETPIQRTAVPAAGEAQPVAAETAPASTAGASPSVVTPAIAGQADGQIAEEDATRVRNAVANVAVTDPGLRPSIGAAPELALIGAANPDGVGTARAALEMDSAAAAEAGRAAAAAPMGEDTIRAAAPATTLVAGSGAGAAASGGAASTTPVEAGSRAELIVADAQGGQSVRAAAAGAATRIQGARTSRNSEAVDRRAESRTAIDEAVAADSELQAETRRTARADVAAHRRDWRAAESGAVTAAQAEATGLDSGARTEIDGHATTARSGAATHVADGASETERLARDAERRAQARRDEAAREADRGVLGWLASRVTSFFRALRDGLHALFDAARAAVSRAIARAQQLAADVINAASRWIVARIRSAANAILAVADRLLAGFPGLRDRFRVLITAVVDRAVAAVERLASLLTQAIQRLLDGLGAALTAILSAYELLYRTIIDAVAAAVNGALRIARAAIAALGIFAALIGDIAPGPAAWLGKLGAAVSDGIRNHLWAALKTAVKRWFNDTIQSIIGLGRLVLTTLLKGGIDLRKIAKFVWAAIIAALPTIIIQFLIQRLIAMIVPAAGAVMLVIQGLQAAWGAISQILAAASAFVTFLLAVNGGGAGPLFAAALAASAVAVIAFLSQFLMARMRGAAGGVAGRLRALGGRIMAFLRRAGRAVGRGVRAIGRGVRTAGRAALRVAGRAAHAIGRGLGGAGRALARGLGQLGRRLGRTRLGRSLRRACARFRRWRARRRRERVRRRGDDLAKAQSELPGVINPLLARRPLRTLFRAQLLALKLRYRLRRLFIRDNGNDFAVVAVNSPPTIIVNGHKFPLGVMIRIVDEVADDLLAQRWSFQEHRDLGAMRHVGETTDGRPIGYFPGTINFFGRRQEIIGMGRHLPQGETLERRLALLARGGLPRRGLAYPSIQARVEGLPLGPRLAQLLRGYSMQASMDLPSREALGAIFGLWFEFEPGHPYRHSGAIVPGSRQLPKATFGHRRDFAYSLMATQMMQPERGNRQISPREALSMHPSSFGGAQRGAARVTETVSAGRPLPTSGTRGYRERLRREALLLKTWFAANQQDSKDRPSEAEIRAMVRTRLESSMRRSA